MSDLPNETDSKCEERVDVEEKKSGGDDDDSVLKSCDRKEEQKKAKEPICLPDEDEKRENEKDWTVEQKEEKLDEAKSFRLSGNNLFRSAQYKEAADMYRSAVLACPYSETSEMAIIYSNWAACLTHLEKYDDAIACLNRAIDKNPDYVKAYLRRAKANEQTDKLDEALEDYKKVLELDPGVNEARRACMELPQKINERNEKLKTEMMDKLKQLGNLVLQPFGLSTDNFELKQDPSSGSYSINMKK